jgi:hypothetical protein
MTDVVSDHDVYLFIKEKRNIASVRTAQGQDSDAYDLICDDRYRLRPGDVNYASAKHYLFARWLVEQGWAQGGNQCMFVRIQRRKNATLRIGSSQVWQRASDARIVLRYAMVSSRCQ